MKRSKDVKPEPENDDDSNRPLLSFVIVSHIHGRSIVIKPGPGVDQAKGPGPGFHGSTRVNSGQPGLTQKNKKKIKILIFHMKKSM
jgi:hypothetical protein